jgi:hypothetical protein
LKNLIQAFLIVVSALDWPPVQGFAAVLVWPGLQAIVVVVDADEMWKIVVAVVEDEPPPPQPATVHTTAATTTSSPMRLRDVTQADNN